MKRLITRKALAAAAWTILCFGAVHLVAAQWDASEAPRAIYHEISLFFMAYCAMVVWDQGLSRLLRNPARASTR